MDKGKTKQMSGSVTGDAKPKAKGRPRKTAGKMKNAAGGTKAAVRTK